MSRIREAVSTLCRQIDQIVETTESLPHERVDWKPSDEAWSIMEVLCHVEEAVPYWVDEIQRVVQTPGTEWGRGLQDEARLAAVAAAGQRRIEDVVAGIRNTKQDVESKLGALKEQDLELTAPSRNPRFGTKPMTFVIDHLLIEHLEKHLGQIQRNLEQYQGGVIHG